MHNYEFMNLTVTPTDLDRMLHGWNVRISTSTNLTGVDWSLTGLVQLHDGVVCHVYVVCSAKIGLIYVPCEQRVWLTICATASVPTKPVSQPRFTQLVR